MFLYRINMKSQETTKWTVDYLGIFHIRLVPFHGRLSGLPVPEFVFLPACQTLLL